MPPPTAQRSATPPKITAHKPPRPLGPPPSRASAAFSGVDDATPTRARSSSTATPGAGSSGGGAVAAALPKTGWLVKESGQSLLGKRTWQRRYVVLDAGVLQYFQSREAHDRGEPALRGNLVRVAEYRVVEGGADGADIVLEPLPPDAKGAAAAAPSSAPTPGRSWRFRCEARADVRAWADALVAHGAGAAAS